MHKSTQKCSLQLEHLVARLWSSQKSNIDTSAPGATGAGCATCCCMQPGRRLTLRTQQEGATVSLHDLKVGVHNDVRVLLDEDQAWLLQTQRTKTSVEQVSLMAIVASCKGHSEFIQTFSAVCMLRISAWQWTRSKNHHRDIA